MKFLTGGGAPKEDRYSVIGERVWCPTRRGDKLPVQINSLGCTRGIGHTCNMHPVVAGNVSRCSKNEVVVVRSSSVEFDFASLADADIPIVIWISDITRDEE